MNNNKNQLRLFISIDMPLQVQEMIASIQQQLQQSSLFSGTFVRPTDAHLTLTFLGAVEETAIPLIIEKLGQIRTNSFKACTGNIGVLPTHHQINIIYLDIINPLLIALAQQIRNQLPPFVPHENRPWLSHVTIARIKKVYDRLMLLAFLKELQIPLTCFDMSEFVLKQSILSSEGPSYNTIARFKLQ